MPKSLPRQELDIARSALQRAIDLLNSDRHRQAVYLYKHPPMDGSELAVTHDSSMQEFCRFANREAIKKRREQHVKFFEERIKRSEEDVSARGQEFVDASIKLELAKVEYFGPYIRHCTVDCLTKPSDEAPVLDRLRYGLSVFDDQ
jgi:hypothetical protein